MGSDQKELLGALLGAGKDFVFDLGDGYTGVCSIIAILLIYCTFMFCAHLGLGFIHN